MPRYVFFCEECETTKEYIRSIKQGPPKKVLCKLCHKQMNRDFDCQFILKGWWPGKEAKGMTPEREKRIDDMLKQDDKIVGGKKEASEVLSNRRKGTRHWKEWKKQNKTKVNRYKENMKKGIKAE